MSFIHRYLGYSVPAGFALLALWALYCFLRNKAPGQGFWRLLAAVQVIIGVQVVIGAILLVSGLAPATPGPVWLHYLYGGLFPVIVLVLAHRVARNAGPIPWVVFGAAAVVNFGLTFRALQTGLGVG